MAKKRSVANRLDQLPPKPRRVFGALRGAVYTDPSFFEPLPVAELEAWTATSKKRRAPSTQERLASSLRAFWVIAEDWNLTTVEQCALLAVSASTLSRWRVRAPSSKRAANRTLDRLFLILLLYVRLCEKYAQAMGINTDTLPWLVHWPGSAHNPYAPEQSVIDMLSERSVLAMLSHYRRLTERLATEPADA